MIGAAKQIAAQKTKQQRAADAAYQAELRRLRLANRQAALDLRVAKAQAAIDRQDARNASEIKRLEAQRAAEDEATLAPIRAQAGIDTQDTTTRATFIKALPWLVGAALVGGALWFKRRGRSR